MHQFLTAIGSSTPNLVPNIVTCRITRKVSIVNLDPANDHIPYPCAVDIADLITLEDTMETLGLGPNGGMMYCMEFLQKNFDWLLEKLKELGDDYVIFDCPGQVELYTHHNAVKDIIERLQKLDYRLTFILLLSLPQLVAVHLVDAHYCTDPTKFISVLLLSLKTMIQLELPHVNVLSKVDLMESYGKLTFNLEYYTEVMDLSYLLFNLNEDTFGSSLSSPVSLDLHLTSFLTHGPQDKASVTNLLKVIDKANGYVFGGLTQNNESIMLTAVRSGIGYQEDVSEVQERWLDSREAYEKWERKEEENKKDGTKREPGKAASRGAVRIVEREAGFGSETIGDGGGRDFERSAHKLPALSTRVKPASAEGSLQAAKERIDEFHTGGMEASSGGSKRARKILRSSAKNCSRFSNRQDVGARRCYCHQRRSTCKQRQRVQNDQGVEDMKDREIRAAFSWIFDLDNLVTFDEQLSCRHQHSHELMQPIDHRTIHGHENGNIEMPMGTSLLQKLLFTLANEWEIIPNPLMGPELSEGNFTKIAVAPPVRILARIISEVIKLRLNESKRYRGPSTDKVIGGGEVAGPPWQQTMEKRINKDNLDSALRQYECEESMKIVLKTTITSFIAEGME
ncbi:hypothetical protein BC936DRAFT_138704 [Jimgerdemannia flammicorona]|uniref:ATP-binding domain 1 family member B homolog n=1 Tax=Jimgerdemannia flammicorona TaxID=994334 RepID=A0A433DI41_9FUNG|nr:hypothetical protein BC936DRAFT_138704 [Jimgerdemannia flammicorona]